MATTKIKLIVTLEVNTNNTPEFEAEKTRIAKTADAIIKATFNKGKDIGNTSNIINVTTSIKQ